MLIISRALCLVLSGGSPMAHVGHLTSPLDWCMLSMYLSVCFSVDNRTCYLRMSLGPHNHVVPPPFVPLHTQSSLPILLPCISQYSAPTPSHCWSLFVISQSKEMCRHHYRQWCHFIVFIDIPSMYWLKCRPITQLKFKTRWLLSICKLFWLFTRFGELLLEKCW